MRYMFVAGLLTVLALGACATPRADCLRPECPNGWFAGGGDTVALMPSAAGGTMLVEPGEQRVVSLDSVDAELSVAGGWGAETLTLPTGELTRIDAPYAHEEIRYESGDTRLAGLLLAPEDARAGVVLVHGSGDVTRDNGWTLRIAHHLASHDIAVIVPDKRGAGKSEGDWRAADFEDLAADAVAGAETLREHVGSGAVGVLGISQAGWVVPIALETSAAVDYAVSLVGPAVPYAEQQQYVLETSLTAAGVPAPLQQQVMRLYELGTTYGRTGEGWDDYEALRNTIAAGPLAPLLAEFPGDRDHWSWSWGGRIVDADPLPHWRGADKPGLVVLGTEDPSVPAEDSAERLAPVSQVDVWLIEGAGHDLVTPGEDTVGEPLLDRIVAWIRDLG